MVGVLRNGGLMSPQTKRKQSLPSQIEDEEEEDFGLDLDELPMATQEAQESVARKLLQQQQEEEQQQVHAKLSPLHPLHQEERNSSNSEINKNQLGLEERVMELEAKLATLSLVIHEQQAQINQQRIQRGHHDIRQSISPTMGRGGPGGGTMTPPDSPLISSIKNHGNYSFFDDDDDNSNNGGQDVMTRAGPFLESPAAPQSRRNTHNRRDHSRRRNLSFKLLYQQSEFPQPHEVYGSDSQGSIDDEDGNTTGNGGVVGEERQTLNEQTAATTTHDYVTRLSSTMADTTSSATSSSPTATYGGDDATPKKTNTGGGRSRSSSIISNGSMQEPPEDFFEKLSESMAQSNSILVGEEHHSKGRNLGATTTPSLLLSTSSTSASPFSGPRSMPLLDDPIPLLVATGADLHAFGLRKRDNATESTDGATTTTGDAALTSNATGIQATTPLIRTTTAPAILSTSTSPPATAATGTTTSSEFFVTPKILSHSTSTTSIEGSASINNINNTKNAASTKSNLRLKWLDYLNSFQETSYDVDFQMEEFVKVPSAVESLLSFGFWICMDSFLDCLTILPIRAAWGCLLLQRYVVLKATIHRHTEVPDGPYRFHRRHSYQLIQVGIIYTVYKYALMPISIGKLYHWIRGQSMIKLYVLIAIVEVFDRLLCSLGQDCLDSLYWNTTRRPRSSRWVVAVMVVVVYAMVHSFLLFVHVATLNVAMNSADQALLTLLISGNFAEIKSTVFKKYNKPNLFKITASDICERFKLALFLGLVLVLNICQGMDQKMVMSYCQMCGIVWCAEWLSDWIKHSFITKFNYISSNIYPQYALLLAGDVTGIGHEGVNLDHSHAVVKRIGFAQIPLVCVMARYVSEAAKYATSDWHDASGGGGNGGPPPQWMVALGVIAIWFVLLVGKISLGNLLHSISEKKLNSAPELSKSSTSISMSSGSVKKKS